MLRTARIVLAAIAGLVVAAPALAYHMCPFCGPAGSTLSRDASDAMLIVAGKLANPKFDPNATFQGTTELIIETVVKNHEFLKDKRTIVIDRYLAIEKDRPTRYMVFGDIYNGKLDAYRGIPLAKDSNLDEYLKGALDIKDKDVTTRLDYFFKHLNASEVDVAQDAYMEFAAADYKDFRPLAEKLPPDTIAKWITDENTPPSRLGLYGSMLGHCGKENHAKLLRTILDEPNKRFLTGVDGLLAGFVMLAPKDGLDYLSSIMKDRTKDFMLRYAALRTARFFWEFRPDIVEKKEVEHVVAQLLEQDDIADLAIEDLRKWETWHLTERILGLFDRKSHDVPIIRRAIMRFALSAAAKNQTKAAELVATMRKKDSEWVKDIEELLLLETAPKVPPPKEAGTLRKAADK